MKKRCLFFSVGDKCYALPIKRIVEVIPYIFLERIPKSTSKVLAGVFTYHGVEVPVIDFCYCMQGRECRNVLSSRIIIIPALKNISAMYEYLGVVVERATRISFWVEGQGVNYLKVEELFSDDVQEHLMKIASCEEEGKR